MRWREGEWRGCTSRIDVSRFRQGIGLDAVPITDEKRLFVNCGKCDNCLRDRAKDWVGRTIGEAYGADHTYFVTLTIGGQKYYRERGQEDNLRAFFFDKADVQAYVKRVRFFQRKDWLSGLKERGLNHRLYVPPSMRFFYVGEKGDLKGRVHYHMLAFYYGSEGPRGVPDGEDIFHGKMDESVRGPYELVDDERTYWPWGWSNWKEAKPHHSWYIANYVNKGPLHGASDLMRPGISTRPLLGARYFDLIAGDHVKAMLAPQSRTYHVPDAPHYRGEPVTYWMSDAATRRFAESFMQQWNAAYEADPRSWPRDWPYSEMLERYADVRSVKDHGRTKDAIQDALFERRVTERTRLGGFEPAKWSKWVPGDELLLMTTQEAEELLRRRLRDGEKIRHGF